MIDKFNELWASMSDDERKNISWMAFDHEDYRALGEIDADHLMKVAIAMVDIYAKNKAGTYTEYSEEVIAFSKGMAKGLLDGGMDYYLGEHL